MKQVGPSLPYGYTIFCDDIRQEVGGKSSVMGIYTGELRFASPAPAVMPSLCARIVWVCHKDERPEQIGFAIYRDTPGTRETLFQMNVALGDAQPPITLPDENDPDAPLVVSMVFDARFGMMEFTRDCKLRVRAQVNGQEQRIGAIQIRFPDLAPSNEDALTKSAP